MVIVKLYRHRIYSLMRRYVTDVIKARIVYWHHVITFETRVNENSCILFFEALDNFVAFVPKSCAVFLKC